MSDKTEAALDLVRRLPPQDIEDNLFYLLDLEPDLADTLLSTVDQPLKTQQDARAGRDYLLCDYNRDGDSFRSPWSNTYEPPLDGATFPSDKLREMEVLANKVFDKYREAYFGPGSLSSVYLWDSADDSQANAWAACVLMYKEGKDGTWNSIHVIEVTDSPKDARVPAGHFQYKLTTTIMLSLDEKIDLGSSNLSGSLCRQEVKSFANPKDDTMTHIANIGHMIEDLESRLRTQVDVVYFGRTQEVLSYLRENRGTKETKERKAAQQRVIQEMSKAAI